MTPNDRAGNGSTPHNASNGASGANGAIPHTGRLSRLVDDLHAGAEEQASTSAGGDAIGAALGAGYTLEHWRADGTANALLANPHEHAAAYRFYDQDALNAVPQGR